ncbi:MAG: hypothetical protein HYU77_11025 [Betaproteobacteria bacterium]|nr:hypothetical protein [Betaproteobacteria bacterium]
MSRLQPAKAVNSASALFPDKARGFPGKRWVKIGLRTLHLVGTAGVGGAFLYGAPERLWLPYWWMTVASGVALVAIELWSNGVWLIQVRGVAILAKLVLLACVPLAPDLGGLILILIIVISAVSSHAPASVRYFSLLHGRRIETLSGPVRRS